MRSIVIQENGVENSLGGINAQKQNQPPAQNINVNGQMTPINNNQMNKKMKKCGC